MTDLSPIAPKLARLIPRLATDADGEVVATVRAIWRTLANAGADLHDLAETVSRPRLVCHDARQARSRLTPAEMVMNLFERQGDLSSSEADFIANLHRHAWRGEAMRLTPKQRAWLYKIFETVTGQEVAN